MKNILKHTNIKKVETLYVLHDKVALLMRKRSERGTRNRHRRILRKVWTMYTENGDQRGIFYMTLIRLRLGFLFADLSQSFAIYLVVFNSRVKSGSKSFHCVVKSKVIEPKYKTIYFLKYYSLRKRLLRDLH